jgi:hypothetical protein
MSMFPRSLAHALRGLGLIMMVVAALFGIPIIIDPPPRDHSADVQETGGRSGRPRPRQRRAS